MKHLFSAVAMLLFAISTQAAPLWLRYPSISPDGKTIAFAYKGSIYTVATTGGTATRITLWPTTTHHLFGRPIQRQLPMQAIAMVTSISSPSRLRVVLQIVLRPSLEQIHHMHSLTMVRRFTMAQPSPTPHRTYSSPRAIWASCTP